MPAKYFGLPTTRSARRLVVSLSGTTLLLWIGGSAILPLLPSYLRRHGADPALVGVIMAAYFAASVATQYPVGRLSDRIGRRPVVLGGLVVFAIGSVGFAVLSGAAPAIIFRALQGVGAGAVTVAAAATIGTEVAVPERGAAFGALYGSQMLALAVGPLVGSIAGVQSMGVLFLAAAGVALVATVPVLAVVPAGRGTLTGPDPACYRLGADGTALGSTARLEELEALAACAPGGVSRGGPAGGSGDSPARSAPRRGRIRLDGPFVGVLVVFGATGLLAGVYESCWTLLMVLRHATSTQVGLSWTLFALPFALLSVPAGRLAGRFDRRALTLVALGSSAAFCALYPFLHSVAVLVVCCTFEAIGAVIGTPAAVLVLTAAIPANAQGEAQGSVETARTAATAVAAAASGALFGIDPLVPFVASAGIVLVACVAVGVAWRSLPGHDDLGAELEAPVASTVLP